MPLAAVTFDLATVGLAVEGIVENPAEILLVLAVGFDNLVLVRLAMVSLLSTGGRFE